MALKECTKKEAANSYELVVSVDGETFEKAINKIYKKQVKSINIPGFRKGKAPRHIIERMYGKEVFYDDAMQECYPDALYDASQEQGIEIVAVENLEIVEAGKEGFTFKASVIVKPELEVDGYIGIEVTKPSTEVTEELIDKEIESVRDRNSRMVTVEDRAAEMGDTTVIDFEGSVDGVPFEGGKAEKFSLALGSGNFIPGFEEQVVGHTTGEEFTITVTFPEDYQAEELKGKEAEFKIVLHEIKTKELPEVDDEFVKDVSEKETVAEYREELRETIAKRLVDEAEKDVDNQISDKLVELAQGEIPEAMYERQVDEMVRDFENRLHSQGLNIGLNEYLQYMGMDMDSLRNVYRADAEKMVKRKLVLEAIARKENIEVTEEDIEKEFADLAELYKLEVAQVKVAVPVETIKENLTVRKALAFVKENAVIN